MILVFNLNFWSWFLVFSLFIKFNFVKYMTHLFLLCLHIVFIILLWFNFDWNALIYLKTKFANSIYFFRIVSKKSQ